MTATKPTGEQLRFVSEKTGEHSLDTYLEAAEQGTRTLSDLIADMWDASGNVRTNVFQLRLKPDTSRQLQARFGTWVDPNAGWIDVTDAYVFRHRGNWAASTVYKYLDLVSHGGAQYICLTEHTSSGSDPDANFAGFSGPSDAVNINFSAAGTIAATDVQNALEELDSETQAALANKSETSHAHAFAAITSKPTTITGYGITDAYTKAEVDASLSGKADTSHSHDISDVTNLQTNLDGKADTSHSHAIGDVTNLQTTLDGKAASSHNHAIGDVTNLQTELDGKAASSHSHGISDVTNLQTELDGKSATSHGHIIDDTTGLQAALDGKSATSHGHANATPSTDGAMSAADKTKLDGVASGAEVNPAPISQAEAEAGTDTNERVVTAQRIKQAIDALTPAVTTYYTIELVRPDKDCETGDGKFYLHIPPELNGFNLTYVHAFVVTAGTTSTMDVQIHNLTDSLDMLSTKLTIDSGEVGSDTAATAAVIDTGADDVATNDRLRIDIDAIHTTPAKGLTLTLGFDKP